ncbi:unnamed protein product [Parascedosporium putredinis]|uniref:Uncharacterized protein n=1 Tax=Parascedosporium putredinis TaxID=1442378 RepID=A0A9P1MD07_9PEZI|nr:unnamed protein product [Parascedosporium putredinis]CAI8001738.1 unnamed protein product [Parascedosporium putredinis]
MDQFSETRSLVMDPDGDILAILRIPSTPFAPWDNNEEKEAASESEVPNSPTEESYIAPSEDDPPRRLR